MSIKTDGKNFRLKEDIKNEILDLLKKNHMGLSIRSISDKLKRSRTTITKYLKVLAKDRLVVDQKIGQYRVWIFKDSKLDVDDSLVYSINNYMLKNLSKLDLGKEDIKKLGKLVAKDANFSKYLDIKHLIGVGEVPTPKIFAESLMKIIDSICLFFDNYSWHPPLLREDSSMIDSPITIRMYDSDRISNPNHFHLISGFIEYEMNKIIKERLKIKIQMEIQVNVIQIQEKEKLVDFQFEIFI